MRVSTGRASMIARVRGPRRPQIITSTRISLPGSLREAVMPVDSRTHQPFGLLHGGASVVLAETLGSVAGYLCTEGEQKAVGLEVNANHIRSVRSGRVRERDFVPFALMINKAKVHGFAISAMLVMDFL